MWRISVSSCKKIVLDTLLILKFGIFFIWWLFLLTSRSSGLSGNYTWERNAGQTFSGPSGQTAMEWEGDNQPCQTKKKKKKSLQKQKSSRGCFHTTPAVLLSLSHFQCFQSIFSLLIPTFEQFPNPVLTVASPQGEKSHFCSFSGRICLVLHHLLNLDGSAVPWAGNWWDAHHFLGTWWEKAERQCQEQGGREHLCRALLWTIFTSFTLFLVSSTRGCPAEVPIHTRAAARFMCHQLQTGLLLGVWLKHKVPHDDKCCQTLSAQTPGWI